MIIDMNGTSGVGKSCLSKIVCGENMECELNQAKSYKSVDFLTLVTSILNSLWILKFLFKLNVNSFWKCYKKMLIYQICYRKMKQEQNGSIKFIHTHGILLNLVYLYKKSQNSVSKKWLVEQVMSKTYKADLYIYIDVKPEEIKRRRSKRASGIDKGNRLKLSFIQDQIERYEEFVGELKYYFKNKETKVINFKNHGTKKKMAKELKQLLNAN